MITLLSNLISPI